MTDSTTRWDTVAIVGVGLLGGSIGLALRKKKLARKVIGIGRTAASLRRARARGAVDSTTTELARGVGDAELIVICTPVADVVRYVRDTSEYCPDGALITDVASIKEDIVSTLQRGVHPDAVYVGSHPLAGSHNAGPNHARADLFEDRAVVVTPTRRTKSTDYQATARFWRELGARVVKMTPREHDRLVASTSHVPHLLASALAAAAAKDELQLVSSGWSDTTRIAAGDVKLWAQILSGNRLQVLKSLSKFEKVLWSLRSALERNDTAMLEKILREGKRHRDAVGS